MAEDDRLLPPPPPPGGKLLKNKNLERTFPGGNVLLSFGAQSGS
ncbi:MAG: hypothetical protein ACTS6G_06105 [Candidatus Hodgkinia cicadicola]